jgi:hypothetical protein
MQDRKTSSVEVSLVELDCNVLRNIIHLLFTAKKKKDLLEGNSFNSQEWRCFPKNV